MAYLRNTTVNLLNLHYGVHAFVLNGAGAFYSVYLLNAGVPVYAVFAAYGAILIGRLAIRPLVLVLALKIGLRAVVVFGTVLSAVQYFLLPEVRGVDGMLLVVVIAASAGDTFYWTSYHAYFASLGDLEHRGHQVGAREALASLAAIVGPLVHAWALVVFGPGIAFGAAGVTLVLSAAPFLGTPDVEVRRDIGGAYRAALPGIALFFADGVTTTGALIVWQVALFLSLHESVAAYGGAMALAGLVGAAAGLLLGRNIDLGHGRRTVLLAYGGYAALIVLRAVSTDTAAFAVTANALGALAASLYMPTLMTAVYNLAKRSPCPLRFHVATEGGWDLGGGGACFVAAALTAMGAPLSNAILIALAGIAASIFLLLRHYGKNAAAASA